MVPLWWDAGTLEDLAAWKSDRLSNGADYDEPFLASLIPGRAVKTFSRHTPRKRFRTACKSLGAVRLESHTIHHGRHTFISHALAGGRSLAEIRDAPRHFNISNTHGLAALRRRQRLTVGAGRGNIGRKLIEPHAAFAVNLGPLFQETCHDRQDVFRRRNQHRLDLCIESARGGCQDL
jgi:hypothetical protein